MACRVRYERTSQAVHLQLYICWKITIMGTSCHKWEGLANSAPRHWQCYLVNWDHHLPKNTVYIDQSIFLINRLITWWWRLRESLEITRCGGIFRLSSPKKTQKALPILVVACYVTIFEGPPLAVVVLPPLSLGSPMIHVSIHGSSVARIDLGK